MRKIFTTLLCAAMTMTALAAVPQGALSGMFSVSSTKQVVFSQGNLQYRASTDTWQFAANQWDIIGAANSNISETYEGWIDLLGWGTGSNPTEISTDNSSYSAFTDWGVNQITNGGNAANKWRTLTKDEWEYLFGSRANYENLRGLAKINGVCGYILLPDDWTDAPEGLIFTPNPSNYTTNVYTAAEWSEKMGPAGAVFFPNTGFRKEGTSVNYVSDNAHYWLSTPDPDDAAKAWYFTSSSWFSNANKNERNQGRAVRLVQNVPQVGDTIINQVDSKDMYFKITSLDPREVMLIPHNDWASAFTGALNIPDSAVLYGEKYAVVEIAAGAVSSQYQITSVKLPKGLREINNYAFQSCGISSITFPASIEYIAGYAFGYCASLTEVHFEGTDNLEQIISNAFGYTPLLENAPNGWIIADSVAIDYRGISPELLAVPDSVTFISMLHSRGNNGYSHNWESTTGVRLGHKVKAITMGAFSDCVNATSLSICAPIPPKVSYSATKPFNARENTMRLKLSCELTDAELTAYNAADYWGNRFEGIDTVLIWNVNLVQTVGGTIAFEGTPDCSGATVVATPASGYKFVRWSDDSTDNPHTFVITADTEISAVFDVASGINSSSLQGGERGRLFIHDGQIFILRGDKTYTVTGQEVR